MYYGRNVKTIELFSICESVNSAEHTITYNSSEYCSLPSPWFINIYFKSINGFLFVKQPFLDVHKYPLQLTRLLNNTEMLFWLLDLDVALGKLSFLSMI